MSDLRALVVDDDPAVLAIAKLALTRLGGFAVAVAEDGEEALAILQNPEDPGFSVVLLDLMMPGMDGRQTLAAMRARPGLEQLPVIFASAAAESRALAGIEDAWVIGEVAKPFLPTELPGKVLALLKAAGRG